MINGCQILIQPEEIFKGFSIKSILPKKPLKAICVSLQVINGQIFQGSLKTGNVSRPLGVNVCKFLNTEIMRSIIALLLPLSLMFAACSGDQNGDQNGEQGGDETTGELTINEEGTTAEDAAAADAENIEEVRTVKRNLDTETFREEIQSNDAVLIDVRTDREWNNGRIPGSVQMNIHRPEFQENLSAFPRDQKLYFYCASGRRTQEALSIAERLGFHNVSHLSRGINSWQREGFELERD